MEIQEIVFKIGTKETLGIIFSMVGLVATFTWFLAGKFTRIDVTIERINFIIGKIETSLGHIEQRLFRIENSCSSMDQRITRLEAKN